MNDKILMPRELTAENGAKGLLIGEFYEETELSCPECEGDEVAECEICGDGSGQYIQKTPVSWTTIKEIYKMAVKHLGEEGPC